jgi:hypothetical protein
MFGRELVEEVRFRRCMRFKDALEREGPLLQVSAISRRTVKREISAEQVEGLENTVVLSHELLKRIGLCRKKDL